MKFELGAYSFGAAEKSPEGETVSTAQAVLRFVPSPGRPVGGAEVEVPDLASAR